MHEARWNREKNDADNKRTRASILRAAISNASNERTSRQWARAALSEHTVAPEQARALPVEHSALPQWLEGQQSSISRFQNIQNKFERHLSSNLRLRGTLERPFRASCDFGPSSSGHFTSQLRLRAKLERPFRASSCGARPSSSGYFELAVAPGQARTVISSQLRLRARLDRPFRFVRLQARLDVGNVGRCGVFEENRSHEAPKSEIRKFHSAADGCRFLIHFTFPMWVCGSLRNYPVPPFRCRRVSFSQTFHFSYMAP
jgi:hypothetical protein